jgi:surface antigen
MLLATVNANAAAPDCSKKFNFGEFLGEYNGVLAYSNGQPCYFSNIKNKYANYTTGYQYQCVEYVNRYYKQKFSRELGNGDANTYCANASQKNLNKSDNGKTTDKPQPNNIICSKGGDHGHCAIVREVGNDYVKVIEQNFNENKVDTNHKLTLTKDKKGQYTVGGFSSNYPVQCWMWSKK